MRTFSALSLVVALLLTLVGTRPAHAVPDVELAVIVHAANKSFALSRPELEALFTGSQSRWDGGGPVVALNLPTGTAARGVFDRAVLNLDPDQVGRFWIDRRIRGLGMPPKQVPDASIGARVVAKIAGAISYVPREVAVDRVKVVARIRQGKVLPP